MMSATCGKPSVRRRCAAAFGEKLASGSSPVTTSSARRRVPWRPRTIGPWAAERTTRSAMREGARVALLHPLERPPRALSGEVDEPGVPRAEDDDVARRQRLRLALGAAL